MRVNLGLLPVYLTLRLAYTHISRPIFYQIWYLDSCCLEQEQISFGGALGSDLHACA